MNKIKKIAKGDSLTLHTDTTVYGSTFSEDAWDVLDKQLFLYKRQTDNSFKEVSIIDDQIFFQGGFDSDKAQYFGSKSIAPILVISHNFTENNDGDFRVTFRGRVPGNKYSNYTFFEENIRVNSLEEMFPKVNRYHRILKEVKTMRESIGDRVFNLFFWALFILIFSGTLASLSISINS